MTAATVAEYLLQQLQESGVDHVFGVPGDYVLGFYKILAASPLEHIGTTVRIQVPLQPMATPVAGVSGTAP